MGDELQKLLDQCILDYMRRNNMPATAEIFAMEANVTPDTPDPNPDPEGFLAEWWSIFWPIYSSQLANNPDETASNVMTPQTEISELPNLPQTEISSTMEIAPNMMPTPELNPISFRASSVMTPQTVLIREFISLRQTEIRSTMAIAPNMMQPPGYSVPTMTPTPELNTTGSSVNPVYVNDDSLPTASNVTPQTALIPGLPNPRQTEISSAMVTSSNVMPTPEVDHQDAVDARRRRKQLLAERRLQRVMIGDPPAVEQLASIRTCLDNPSTSGNVAAEPISREPSFTHLELPERSETASPNPTTPTAAPNESGNLS